MWVPLFKKMDEKAKFLQEKMQKTASGERNVEVLMEYSSDDDEDCEDVNGGEQPKTRQAEALLKNSAKSYAGVTTSHGFRKNLNKTLLVVPQTKISIFDALKDFEAANLDGELEGIQLIHRNTVLEVVMKTEKAMNLLLEGSCD